MMTFLGWFTFKQWRSKGWWRPRASKHISALPEKIPLQKQVFNNAPKKSHPLRKTDAKKLMHLNILKDFLTKILCLYPQYEGRFWQIRHNFMKKKIIRWNI